MFTSGRSEPARDAGRQAFGDKSFVAELPLPMLGAAADAGRCIRETAEWPPGVAMQKMSIIIRAEWDAEAKVYVATSDDVPGLITEAPTPERLIEKLGALVPELLALNDTGVGDVAARTEREIPMYVVHQHTSRVRIYA